MRKLILVFAIGQFILAAVLCVICVEFAEATENSEKLETQIFQNCDKIKNSLGHIKNSHVKANRILDNVSVQLPRIGNGLEKIGWTINGISPGEPGTPVVEAGVICKDASKLLKQYNSQAAPAMQNALTETEQSVEMVGKIVYEQKPYTTASHYTLLLGIALIAICLLNGTALVIFSMTAYKK